MWSWWGQSKDIKHHGLSSKEMKQAQTMVFVEEILNNKDVGTDNKLTAPAVTQNE